MKLGLITEEKSWISLDWSCQEEYSLFNFVISGTTRSFTHIFDSPFASPSRYVMEVFRRMLSPKAGCRQGGCFIFNPVCKVSAEAFSSVLKQLADSVDFLSPRVISNEENFPVGYFLPDSLSSSESHYLSLLSTVDSLLDQRLLNRLFFSSGAVSVCRDFPPVVYGNGFYPGEQRNKVYHWIASSAVSTLGKLFPKEIRRLNVVDREPDDITYKRKLRDSIPFVAYLPYHAGDVLFYTIAARQIESHVSKLCVNGQYVDILQDVDPQYGREVIDAPLPNRNGLKVSDEDYFLAVTPQLSPFCFYAYLRPSRDSYVSQFHLIDKIGFALGRSYVESEELILMSSPDVPLFKPEIPTKPYRVLLHFDAGWGLKVYPEQSQKQIIQLLLDAGISITILGTEDIHHGAYRSFKFRSFSQLKELLLTHHLIVGSDSFPSHYATHCLGLPTICLFGNSTVANAAANSSGKYCSLENGLDCLPCTELDFCFKYARNYCGNFVSPEQLFDVITAMLESVYGK